ncbi:MAG TPA: DR2241 family protein [Chthoniobacterales bacterium]|jgi:sirohydrochlorin cobaltochelatase|nr:DR2241 family protein [Chthoniobacterales bacterium]
MIRDRLQRILAIGSLNLGEINARRITDTSFIVRHRQDAEPREGPPLRIYTEPAAARDLARFDREGRFRPLKGAPTLPAGWELRLDSIDSLKLAIDYFYPGALASWFAREDRRINPVDLRTTLNRQTGMYRVTQKLTNAEADELAGRFCRSDGGCLRTILWTIAGKRPDGNLPETKFAISDDQLGKDNPALPFLCLEACNLFVAEARETVKQRST